MNKEKVLSILETRGLNPLKKLGQNFLVDDNLTQKIVNSIDYENVDLILEIGPGLGALTEYLVEKDIKYIGVELDKGSSKYLKENIVSKNSFEIIIEDFLKIDINEIFSQYKNIVIVSNLPYYITTPIIEKIITSKINYKSLTFMMQKEVGERILSKPDSKKYSSLSIFIQYFTNVRKVTDVSSNSYYPKPNVDSIVLELQKKEFKEIDIKFFKFVQKCFNSRRKTILNNISNISSHSKDEIKEILSKINIDSRKRPENLLIDDFLSLYSHFK